MTPDPLDRPITLRELLDAVSVREGTRPARTFMGKVVDTMVEKASVTDFVQVSFGGYGRYTYCVPGQPARRVQVGDLVTVQPGEMSSAPAVGKVTAINLPAPKSGIGAKAVAISPEDADRIEAIIGKIR